MTENTPDTTDAQTGTVTQIRPAERLRQYVMARAAEGNPNRAAEVMDSQLDRILMATEDGDADAIWDADAGGTIQGRDIAGLEVRIYNLEFVRSTRADIVSKTGAYASMDATVLGGPREVLQRTGLSLGDDFVLQTGAELFWCKIRAFEARQMLPMDGVVVGIETAGGNTVIKFGRMPERTVPASAE